MDSADILRGHKYLMLGFEDYIASRILLSSRQYRSALVLASSAVEKYLKSFLTLRRNDFKFHLNKFKSAADLQSEVNLPFLDSIDNTFIELMCSAYSFRYYDQIKKPIHIAFVVHQLLWELDHFVEICESEFANEASQTGLRSPFLESFEQKSEFLFNENYVLSGVDKNEHMRKLGHVYVLFFDTDLSVNELQGPLSHDGYNGRMLSVAEVGLK